LPVAVDAAAYAGAHLVILVRDASAAGDAAPATATLLAVPDDGGDGPFGGLVGRYAAALDAGVGADAAFAAATAGAGWEAVPAEPG
jgi:hypothetical protein